VNVDKEFNLVFKGEIAKPHDLHGVRKKLATIFKIPDEKVDRLFSGTPFVIKKNIAKADALVLQQKLSAIGAITHIEPVNLVGLSAAVQAHKAATVRVSIAKPEASTKAASTHAPSAAMSLAPTTPQNVSRPEPEFHDDIEAEPSMRYSISATQIIPLGMVVLAAVLLIAYFPLPDMMLKKGFAIGGLLMFFAVRKLRN
jgi:hypothetical protein